MSLLLPIRPLKQWIMWTFLGISEVEKERLKLGPLEELSSQELILKSSDNFPNSPAGKTGAKMITLQVQPHFDQSAFSQMFLAPLFKPKFHAKIRKLDLVLLPFLWIESFIVSFSRCSTLLWF